MNRPKVFTDFHHASLLNSLTLLFEKRLGGEVYRPIGIEWYNEGFWNVYPHRDTAEQYLGLRDGYQPKDGTPPLNEIADTPKEGIYYCQDIDSGGQNKAITLEAFKNMQFDILIASLPQHIEPFKKLIQLYQPQAKLIFQIGNAWNVPQGVGVKNVMASAIVPNVPHGVNFVSYHQEFSLDIFSRAPFIESKKIYSFINCLGVVDNHKADYELFTELERLLPDWEFKSFGGQCRDGAIKGGEAIAEKMKEAEFIFHCKLGGDGYGHIIHNAAAIGRSLITRKSDYVGKLADPLIVEGQTSILVDGRTPEQIAENIQDAHLRYGQIFSQSMYDKFKEVVDFDKEEAKIREFLNNLL